VNCIVIHGKTVLITNLVYFGNRLFSGGNQFIDRDDFAQVIFKFTEFIRIRRSFGSLECVGLSPQVSTATSYGHGADHSACSIRHFGELMSRNPKLWFSCEQSGLCDAISDKAIRTGDSAMGRGVFFRRFLPIFRRPYPRKLCAVSLYCPP